MREIVLVREVSREMMLRSFESLMYSTIRTRDFHDLPSPERLSSYSSVEPREPSSIKSRRGAIWTA